MVPDMALELSSRAGRSVLARATMVEIESMLFKIDGREFVNAWSFEDGV